MTEKDKKDKRRNLFIFSSVFLSIPDMLDVSNYSEESVSKIECSVKRPNMRLEVQVYFSFQIIHNHKGN